MFLDYYSGQQGGLCNDENDVIRSVSDCEEALKELGYSSLNKFFITSTDPIPAGCSIHVAGSNPHFLETTSGLGKRRQDLTPVCKENGTNVLVYLKRRNNQKRSNICKIIVLLHSLF